MKLRKTASRRQRKTVVQLTDTINQILRSDVATVEKSIDFSTIICAKCNRTEKDGQGYFVRYTRYYGY